MAFSSMIFAEKFEVRKRLTDLRITGNDRPYINGEVIRIWGSLENEPHG